MIQSPGGVLEVAGCENVDVSEVRGSGLLRGAAAVPGPRLAPRLPPVRGVRQGPQPRHTRGGEAEHLVYSLSVSTVSINLYYIIVKLREREGQRVDLGRSLKGHL